MCLTLKNDLNHYMEKKYKPISRYERLNNPAFIHQFNIDNIEHYVLRSVQSVDEETNRIITENKFVKRSDDDLAQFKVSDFYLDNLKASGAIDNLKPASLSRDALSATAHATQAVQSIINSSSN